MEFGTPAAECSDAALLQQRLWRSDPEGWAGLAAPQNVPVFDVLLAETGVGAGRSVLDIGCGSGEMLVRARDLGAQVAGVDITPGLLEIARRRLPDADLWYADMERLPAADGRFDVVLGLNAFQFAGDPLRALAEAARVCRAGGQVAIGMFAEPERCESTAIHLAMSAVSPPSRQAAHTPYGLSGPGQLEAAVQSVGLTPRGAGEVECVWRYETQADAVRGLLSSAGATRAVEDAGREVVVSVIRSALGPFTDPTSGVVSMHNVFRWLTADKPTG
jgi:hypothetical protein